jgi:signal transduction histidine kinase
VLISLPTPAGRLRVVVAVGEGLEDLVGYDVPTTSKKARTLKRGQSERVDSLLADPDVDQVLAGRLGAVTALFVPLISHGKRLGIIYAFNKEGPDPRFTDDDVRLGEAFGTRAALAVYLSERVARETVDAILEAQEGERSRIARELHDETGAALTGFLLGLAAIDEATTLAEARGASAALRKSASTALENVARLAFALRPPALDEFGLAPALRDLSRSLEERGGPSVELEVDLPADARLPAKLEATIFRISQEALTNVVKHAHAETVRVRLTCHERSVVLAIEDDGRGFTRKDEGDGGFGLVGMRERVASHDGSLAVESSLGAGTRISVEIPFSA